MEGSHLGRALLNLVLLYTKEGSKNLRQEQKYTLDDLFAALKNLKDSLAEKKEAENVSFDADTEVHTLEVRRLKDLITIYTDQVILFTEELTQLRRDGEQLQQDLKNLEGQAEAARQTLDDEIQYLVDLEKEFVEQNAQYDYTLQLLSGILATITEAEMHYQNAQFKVSSFIEKNKDSFEKIDILLEGSLKKIFQSKPYYFTPYHQVLAELKAAEKSGQEQPLDFAKFREIVSGLYTYLENGKVLLGQEYEKTKSIHEALIEDLKSTINRIQNILIPDVNLQIEANEEQQTQKAIQLSDANANKNTEEHNLETENESYEKRKRIHELLIPQFDKETQTVEEAEQILLTYLQQNDDVADF